MDPGLLRPYHLIKSGVKASAAAAAADFTVFPPVPRSAAAFLLDGIAALADHRYHLIKPRWRWARQAT
jgi:hypothetical protein